MKLNRAERDYYAVRITTSPPLEGDWEASFDGGETWVPGSLDEDSFSTWLVAGPDYDAAAVNEDPGDTQAVITRNMKPLLRLAADPVLILDKGPSINFA